MILPDGRVLNQELLKAGLVWWYRKYSDDTHLGGLEAEARAAQRGLWADPHAVPPTARMNPLKSTIYLSSLSKPYEGLSSLYRPLSYRGQPSYLEPFSSVHRFDSHMRLD